MNFKVHQSQIRTIKHDDPRFRITDKFTTTPRAGFKISASCPHAYREVIEQCISNGWLRPVANMTEREILFMGLSNE